MSEQDGIPPDEADEQQKTLKRVRTGIWIGLAVIILLAVVVTIVVLAR